MGHVQGLVDGRLTLADKAGADTGQTLAETSASLLTSVCWTVCKCLCGTFPLVGWFMPKYVSMPGDQVT